MSEEEAFFIARNGAIWACWLDGKPAVNLGSQSETLAAMAQFVAEKTGAKPAPEAPVPAEAVPAPEPTPAPPPSPPREPQMQHERGHERYDVTITGRLYTGRGSREVTILDLSESGCRFHEPFSQLKENTPLTIKIGPVGPMEASVMWCRREHVGLEFTNPLYPSVLEHIRKHFDLRSQ